MNDREKSLVLFGKCCLVFFLLDGLANLTYGYLEIQHATLHFTSVASLLAGTVIICLVKILIGVPVVMLLWNFLIVNAFRVEKIGISQALAIAVLGVSMMMVFGP